MIKNIWILTLLLVCSIIHSQTPKEDLRVKWSEEKIKEIAEMKFTFDGRYKKYFEYKIIRQYNEDGFLIKKLYYDSENKLYKQCDYLYDSKINLASVQTYDGDKMFINKDIYIYDENNRIIQIDKYSSQKNISRYLRYVYSDNYRKIDTFFDTKKRQGILIATQLFDENGNLIEDNNDNCSNEIGEATKKTITYENNRPKEINYFDNEILISKDILSYDENGNMIKSETFSASGEILKKKLTVYNYQNLKTEENYYDIQVHKESGHQNYFIKATAEYQYKFY